MRARQIVAVATALAALTGCRTGGSYSSPAEPRLAGPAPLDSVRGATDTLRIVSFNLEFAERVDSALAMFAWEEELYRADVVLLQEMDSAATRRIAQALGMGYVYYPAIYHRRAKRDFGNAVLSRWPIVDDAKLILPHPSRYAGTHRTATAATLRIRDSLVRVYSTHLGTVFDIGSGARRDQLRAIIDDAERYPRAIIGGDLNSGRVGSVARDRGYSWPTERSARTTRFGALDHVFLRRLAAAGAGVVINNHGASDHRAVWVRAVLR